MAELLLMPLPTPPIIWKSNDSAMIVWGSSTKSRSPNPIRFVICFKYKELSKKNNIKATYD